MAEKHIVVQGAICKCQYGQAPDTLKVLSHDKEYANDKDASKKRIATTKEIGGATLEKNTFGNCMKIGGNPPPPCKPVITEWKDFYNKVTLSNGGNILLEDSKAVCAIAGTPCIEIIDHGQRTEASAQNFKNANKEIQRQINPLVNPQELFQRMELETGYGMSFQEEEKFWEESVDDKQEETIVTITITNISLGKTKIGVIGSEAYSNSGKRIQLDVDYYKVVVEDNKSKSKNIYHVTRDAPIMDTDNPITRKKIKRNLDNKVIEQEYLNVINSAFEPMDEFEFKVAVVPNYHGANAFALKNSKGDNKLKAYPVSLPSDKSWDFYRRKDRNYASEVMIHIGGALNSSGSTMGSVGCFTATNKDAGVNGMTNFFNDIRKRAPKDRLIKIVVQPRKNVKWKFQIEK